MIKCNVCGQFVSIKSYFYTWTCRGDSFMKQPPEPEYAHEKCYSEMTQEKKDSIIETAWIKPSLIKE